MSIIPSNNCIHCFFEPENIRSANFPPGEVEVYYGITKELRSEYQILETYLDRDEKLRADKFRFIEDRDTFVCCHGLLRMMLSKKLRINPAEIIIINDINNKPCLTGNPFYFNITHGRDAFAFAISKFFYVGIDMEDTEQQIDFRPITDTYFSERERKYILDPETDAQNRFFLLWTRKEALLKAFGTGIVTDLKKVELLNGKNVINRATFDGLLCYPLFDEHFIYSEKVSNFLLSIAIPHKTKVTMNQINALDFMTYLS